MTRNAGTCFFVASALRQARRADSTLADRGEFRALLLFEPVLGFAPVLDLLRDLDLDRGLMRVSTSVVVLPGRPLGEIPTKNRRVRMLAVDDLTASVLRAQIQMVDERAHVAGVELVADPYVFTDAADGSQPWKPDAVSRYFARLRARIGLEHLDFHYLRKFMETYGQEMGYSVAQVAMRAGHDPTVAAKHYSGRVAETDRALAKAVASLLKPADNEPPAGALPASN